MNRKIFYIIIISLLLLVSSCSKKTYNVGFDTSGGTKIADQQVKKNDLVVKPNDPEKEGHTFIGWYVGKKEFDFNTKIENHLIIEAKWEKNQYLVKFVTNTDQTIDDVKVKYNEKVSEPYTKQLANHQFLGWYLNDELFDFSTPVKNDITLVAKWEKNVFQVKFDTGYDYSINDKNVITINEIGNFKVTNNLNGIEVKHSLADCGSSLLGNPETNLHCSSVKYCLSLGS